MADKPANVYYYIYLVTSVIPTILIKNCAQSWNEKGGLYAFQLFGITGLNRCRLSFISSFIINVSTKSDNERRKFRLEFFNVIKSVLGNLKNGMVSVMNSGRCKLHKGANRGRILKPWYNYQTNREPHFLWAISNN